MENLQSYKNRIQAIESLARKMEMGELSIAELSELERLTRELHERSIILKYKAFETKVNTTIRQEPAEQITATEEIEEEEVVEGPETSIDFSIFEEAEEVEVEIVPDVEDDITSEQEDEPAIKQTVVEEKTVTVSVEKGGETAEYSRTVSEKITSTGTSFWEQLNIADNSLSSQFQGAKLDTLVGAFGLNEKLRFINELFDGSSELFSDAIKALDNQPNLDAAKVKSAELAAQHNWNAEEESVVDFMTVVNRRYA
jgi:hypothetical protein